jgi:hexosaminidase
MVHAVATMTSKLMCGRIALMLACVAIGAACESPTSVTAEVPAYPAVLPAPAEVMPLAGQFVLTDRTRVASGASDDAKWVAQYFVDLLQQSRGLALSVAADTSGQDPGIALLIDPSVPPVAGAYRLEIDPTGVTVAARDRAGLLYGAVTLWQLIGAGSTGPLALAAMRIDDEPRFAWRGLMLDSARHYQSPEFIEHFIDWMALHKLNVLHWHLTDDQAWRLEIMKYPRLTSVGAWRVPAGRAAAADIDPSTGRPRVYGGYYTQDTVRRIVRHAADRGITIVPEIEMPGHATATIAAYPALGVNGDPAAVPADWGIYPNLFNVEDATFAFLEDVLREVMDLFPGQYIHVGGDEAVKDQWRSSRLVQQRMRERGIGDEKGAAELLRAAHRSLSHRERAAAHRLGRDPRRRPRTRRDRDVLARHRWCARGGRGGSRRGAFAVAHVVLRQSAGHRHHRAARPRHCHRPRDRLSLRPDARRCRLSSVITSSACRQISGPSTSAPRTGFNGWRSRAPRRWPRSAGRRRSASTMRISTGG